LINKEEKMNRLGFIKRLVGFVAGSALVKPDIISSRPKNKIYSAYVKGYKHYDGHKIIHNLQVGSSLQMVPEPNNPFDDCAIAIYSGAYKLGYFPKEDNVVLSSLIASKHGSFEVIVDEVNRDGVYWEKIGFVVWSVG
jgi:hypothetical protein